MRIPFSKWSPCGNITLFLEQPLPAALHVAACAAVLQPSHLYAEQSGTLDFTASPPRLTMMGGEFCVNATRAFAALLASRGYLLQAEPRHWRGYVSVSGAQAPLPVRVTQLDEARFMAAACLQLAPLPAVELLAPGVSLIRLPGITHLILDTTNHPAPCGDPNAVLRSAATWRELYNLDIEEACGVIWVEQTADHVDQMAITPVVRVRETNSAYIETSCGSGSLAAVLSRGVLPSCWTIRQPGGEDLKIVLEKKKVKTTADTDATSQVQWQAWVEGQVTLLAEGVAYVDCYKPQ